MRLGLTGVGVLIFLSATLATASTLLINQKDLGIVSGYGGSGGGLQALGPALNSAFGSTNITVSTDALPPLATLLTYDALVIIPRFGTVLSPAEIQALQSYIGTGRRVLLDGENSFWEAWNNSIMAVVGGSYVSGSNTGFFSDLPVAVHPLTTGINFVNWNSEGIASGGTPLFATNIATLWGSGNVVTVLSNNIFHGDVGYCNTPCGNTRFSVNMANWLADSTATSVPEPSTVVLSILGVVVLALKKNCIARWR